MSEYSRDKNCKQEVAWVFPAIPFDSLIASVKSDPGLPADKSAITSIFPQPTGDGGANSYNSVTGGILRATIGQGQHSDPLIATYPAPHSTLL